MSNDVLLINPDYLKSYKQSFLKFFAPRYPPLNLSTLAANINVNVEILDFTVLKHPIRNLKRSLKNNSFKHIGITLTTPNVDDVKQIIEVVRNYSPSSSIILGGPHITALPRESLKDLKADIVCIGEGDITFKEIVSGKRLSKIRGVGFSKGKEFMLTQKRPLIQNLDSLTIPRWDLINPKKYYTIFSKKNPTGLMETSRGCPYNCIYCYKTLGRLFRFKTPKRVVDEMEFMLQKGFKEVHVADDCFTADIKRAISICDEIIRRKLDVPWGLPNGIRVDSVSQRLLEKLYYSGCHMVAFGIESGSQKVLNSIKKGITVKQIKQTFRLARDVGIETLIAFFMVGLPDEKESDLEKTLELAKILDADITKVSIAIPYPGTLLYEDYKSRGMILNHSWSSYRMHNPQQIYVHSNLTWKEIIDAYNKIILVNKNHLFRFKKILKIYLPRVFHNCAYSIINK